MGCTDKAGFFNYLYLQDCVAVGWQKVALPICWLLILIFVIYILATTADRYFCVTLTDMVEKMGIPPSIAGVTFLSFGNGGPDVFALMTAVINGYTHIGMGSNLGAGHYGRGSLHERVSREPAVFLPRYHHLHRKTQYAS